MQGQGPKMQSILVDPVVSTYEDIAALLDEDCDRNSTEWLHVGIENWGGKEYLDNFFLRPADPEMFKP
jgi:ribose transport system substrate-binding protein